MVKVYADVFLVASKYWKSVDWIRKCFKDEYNVKDLGEVKMIIGYMRLAGRNNEDRSITLRSRSYRSGRSKQLQINQHTYGSW